MALVCAACGAENRLAAKFCIECVAPLPVEFAPTRQMPLRGGGSVPGAEPLPAALAAFTSQPSSLPGARPAAAPQPDAAAALPRVVRTEPKPPRLLTLFTLLAAGFGLAAAAGWFVASHGNVAPVEVVEVPDNPAVARAPVAQAPAQPAVVEPVAATAVAESPAKPHAQARLPSASTSASASAPASAPAPASAAKPPQRAESLFGSCEGLGFVSRERCKVRQCQQSAHRGRAECEPVLAQLRRMEEKRNPTDAN